MFRTLIVLPLAVVTASAETSKDTLRRLWASRAYTRQPVPEAWRVYSIPVAARDLDAFRRYTPTQFTVSEFVSRFGVPDRYLAARQRDQWDFLIYDLPSGAAVALYVREPPHDSFGAAVIIDAQGKLIRLIK